MKLKLNVKREKRIGLVLGNMESRVRALDELAQMRSAVYVVRVASRKSGEEIDHCFRLDANSRIILDGAEDYAIKMSRRSIRLCGLEREGLHVAEVLKME